MNWATPTPIPMPVGTPVIGLDGEAIGITMAENLVQGFQQANQMGALDMLFMAILVLLILGGLWSIMRRIQRV